MKRNFRRNLWILILLIGLSVIIISVWLLNFPSSSQEVEISVLLRNPNVYIDKNVTITGKYISSFCGNIYTAGLYDNEGNCILLEGLSPNCSLSDPQFTEKLNVSIPENAILKITGIFIDCDFGEFIQTHYSIVVTSKDNIIRIQ